MLHIKVLFSLLTPQASQGGDWLHVPSCGKQEVHMLQVVTAGCDLKPTSSYVFFDKGIKSLMRQG